MDSINTICLLFGLVLGYSIGQTVGFSRAFKRCARLISITYDEFNGFLKKELFKDVKTD